MSTPWRNSDGAEVQLHSFSTSGLGSGEWLIWRLGRFTPIQWVPKRRVDHYPHLRRRSRNSTAIPLLHGQY